MAKRVAVDNIEPDPLPKEVTQASKLQEEKQASNDTPTLEEKHEPKDAKKLVTDRILKKSGKSILSAFLVLPPKIHFKNEGIDEQVILLLRAHVVTNVPWIIGAFLLLMVPFVLIPFLVAVGMLPVTPGMTLILTLIWISGVFSFAFLKFLYWYFNVYIVSTEQIVDVDWYNLVYKAVSATLLDKVQDVTSKQGGVLAGIFDYGDVIIQTAGTEANFEFTNVPHPQEVAEEIQNLMSSEGAGEIRVDSVGGGIR